ncbi:6148_t:CDS:1, partial [Gigaspora rosea]
MTRQFSGSARLIDDHLTDRHFIEKAIPIITARIRVKVIKVSAIFEIYLSEKDAGELIVSEITWMQLRPVIKMDF